MTNAAAQSERLRLMKAERNRLREWLDDHRDDRARFPERFPDFAEKQGMYIVLCGEIRKIDGSGLDATHN